jgi:tetratricopeptide (TPR) repeat protein
MALEYAHKRGVIHRDVKPSNILLDNAGQPHLTDFGLAKRDAGELTITLDGQVLGTPANMSPEQARGEGHRVDSRSDVYSLGVILYELLTGELPFRGNPRMQLHQVCHEEPKPPRKLNDRIRRDLETICLKAMAKDPHHRYAGAGDFAIDLRNWLAGKPLMARPEGSFYRVWRWAKQHPVAAGVGAAIALGLSNITGVSVGSALVINNALGGERIALAAAISAKRETEAERERAEDREKLAVDAVKGFRDAIVNNPDLNYRDDLKTLRQALLKEPQEFFRNLREKLQSSGDTRPNTLARLAAAGCDLAQTTFQIGAEEDSLRALLETREIMRRLVQEQPTDARYLSTLARVHQWLGEVQSDTGRRAEALVSYRQAIEIHEHLVREQPAVWEFQRELAGSYIAVGNLQQTTDANAALMSYQQALTIWLRLAQEQPSVTEFQKDLASTYHNIGSVHSTIGRANYAMASFKKALGIRQRLAREKPAVVEFQRDLARSQQHLGNLQRELGQIHEALKSYEQAFQIQKRLAQEYPSVIEFQFILAIAHNDLGSLQRDLHQVSDALISFREALALSERLAKEHPSVTDFQRFLSTT